MEYIEVCKSSANFQKLKYIFILRKRDIATQKQRCRLILMVLF